LKGYSFLGKKIRRGKKNTTSSRKGIRDRKRSRFRVQVDCNLPTRKKGPVPFAGDSGHVLV